MIDTFKCAFAEDNRKPFQWPLELPKLLSETGDTYHKLTFVLTLVTYWSSVLLKLPWLFNPSFPVEKEKKVRKKSVTHWELEEKRALIDDWHNQGKQN